ncbi:helix-turn-helix domain-containing protein [Desulforamulus ruminis]|uniref:helix-turn-helix domain-containing protein n=1 Tax=Desulforamulus ruminis TaxID=1564 RepID=UPI002356C4F7|nr:helix-turn-helix transcriptional regulator [Desulforamulus ruminis]
MIKWKLKQVMVEKGLWTGQDLLDLLEKKAGIILSHTAVMQLIKQEPKAIRLQTLEALCVALDCNPWDLMEYTPTQVKREGKLQAVGESGGPIQPYARHKKTEKLKLNESFYPEEDF